jgi:polysaccharide pyruvyl transferase WcaK-like protein
MRLLVLGDYSGLNLGHTALLLGILAELRRLEPRIMIVPSLRPEMLDRAIGRVESVRTLGVAPWHGSAKFLGPRMAREIDRADVVVVTDNQLHDNALFNPLANNLPALQWVQRRAKRRGVPVTYYNAGVGPLRTSLGRRMAGTVARGFDLVTVRDRPARSALRSLAPQIEAVITGDSGFSMPWVDFGVDLDEDRAGDAVGVNLSVVTLRALAASGFAESEIVTRIARAMSLIADATSARLLFIATHPRDHGLARALATHPASRDASAITVSTHAFLEEAPQLLPRLRLVISDRYHELVALAGAGVPILGLDCGEKVDVLFESLGLPELVMSGSLLLENPREQVTGLVASALDGRRIRDTVSGAARASRAGVERLLKVRRATA